VSSLLKKYRTYPFTSQQQAWVAPGNTKLEFKDWVPKMIPGTNQRAIIAGFEVHVQLNVTVATAAVDPRDVWRAIATLTVQQTDGVNRFNEIPGDALRVFSYLCYGADRTREQQQIPIGAGQNVTFSFYVPLLRPYMQQPYATAMPVDMFQLIRIGMTNNAYMSLGTSAVTINSGSYYVVADCFAEPKAAGVHSYAVDVVTVNDFPNAATTQMQINVQGRPVDQALYVPAAGGGSPITTAQITQANILDLYQQSQFLWPDLITRYARDREWAPGLQGTTNQSPLHIDPFVPDPADGTAPNAGSNPRAVALIMATGNRADEGPIVNNLTENFTELAAPATQPRLITRCLIPRSTKQDVDQAKKYGRKGARKPDATVADSDAGFFPAALV